MRHFSSPPMFFVFKFYLGFEDADGTFPADICWSSTRRARTRRRSARCKRRSWRTWRGATMSPGARRVGALSSSRTFWVVPHGATCFCSGISFSRCMGEGCRLVANVGLMQRGWVVIRRPSNFRSRGMRVISKIAGQTESCVFLTPTTIPFYPARPHGQTVLIPRLPASSRSPGLAPFSDQARFCRSETICTASTTFIAICHDYVTLGF